MTVVLARIEAEDLTHDDGPIDAGAVDRRTGDEAVVSTIGHSDEVDESVEREG